MIATVRPLPPEAGSLYAARRSAGPNPLGSGSVALGLTGRVWRSARHEANPGLGLAEHKRTDAAAPDATSAAVPDGRSAAAPTTSSAAAPTMAANPRCAIRMPAPP